MKKLILIAAMLMASASAHAGSYNFNVDGHKVRVTVPRGCSSLSCINVSAPSLTDKFKSKDERIPRRPSLRRPPLHPLRPRTVAPGCRASARPAGCGCAGCPGTGSGSGSAGFGQAHCAAGTGRHRKQTLPLQPLTPRFRPRLRRLRRRLWSGSR